MTRTTLGWCVCSCLALVGCEASVTRVAAPGNRDGLLINCSAAPANACEFEAKRQCPNGYEVVASQPDRLTVVCHSSPPPEGAVAPATSVTRDRGEKPHEADRAAQPTTVGATAEGAPAPTASARGSEAIGMIYGASLGGGFVQMEEAFDFGYGPERVDEEGWGFAGNVLVAKALSSVFAVGGTASFQQLNALQIGLYDTENSVSLGFLGPDLEVLGCATNCVRFGGAFGVALLSAPALSDVMKAINRSIDTGKIPADPNSSSASLGYDVHIAYELKVAPTWYTGFGFKVLGAGIATDKSVLAYSFLVDVLNR